MNADVKQACGGVLILVKTGLRFLQKNDLSQLKQPLNSCPILISPNNPHVKALRITGKYIQPAARPKLNDVRRLTGGESGNLFHGRRARHILAGDFNHPSWRNGSAEWLGTHGLWTLTNPGLPTFSSGNSLGAFSYVPGDEVPDASLIE